MTFLLLHLGLQLAVADQVRKAELFVWGAGNVYFTKTEKIYEEYIEICYILYIYTKSSF